MTWATSCRNRTCLISTCCGAIANVENAMNSQKHSISPIQLPEGGEVMLLAFHQDQRRWRPVIYVGPPEEPNNASELFVGEWRNSLRKAQITGLKHYFTLYRERYGFSHPEDPNRMRGEGPLPYNVMSFLEGDHMRMSKTYDDEVDGARH